MISCSLLDCHVSVWCLLTLPLFVLLCLAAVQRDIRRDSAGKPACEQCGTRLSTCKVRPKGNPAGDKIGKVCQGCYDVWRGKRPVSSAPSTPALHPAKRQRRAASDPGLSHERLKELQHLAEAEGHGQQGRSRSLLDNALSLFVMFPLFSNWACLLMLLSRL